MVNACRRRGRQRPVATGRCRTVRLISATETVGEQGTINLGLDIQMADGWHTYWRTPGDAGLPPALDWTGSENFKDATLLYPLPERIDENGLQTLGYRGRIVLPIKIQMEHPNHPLKLALKLDMLAYRDWETDRKSTRLNSSHRSLSRMPSSA